MKGNGTTVVVFPGGGYQVLAIDLEGTEVCEWLTSKGIICALLKYRVPNRRANRSGPYPLSAAALQDAQRALRVLRRNSTNWSIDPRRIGVLGFSAGGHLAAAVSTSFERRLYAKIDDADDQSCRPDFANLLYPGHMAKDYKPALGLNPHLTVSKQTPPTLLTHAQDDPVDPVEYSLLYFSALKKNDVRAELHIFAEGEHAFGLRRTDSAITRWPELGAIERFPSPTRVGGQIRSQPDSIQPHLS